MFEDSIRNPLDKHKFQGIGDLVNHYDRVRRRLYIKPKPQLKPIIPPLAEPVPVCIVHTKKLYLSPLPKILNLVATSESLTVEQLTGRSRRHTVVRPRQTAMYLMHEVAKKSYPEIGRKFGGKDHTTVLHACRATLKRATLDPVFADRLQWYVEKVQEMVR